MFRDSVYKLLRLVVKFIPYFIFSVINGCITLYDCQSSMPCLVLCSYYAVINCVPFFEASCCYICHHYANSLVSAIFCTWIYCFLVFVHWFPAYYWPSYFLMPIYLCGICPFPLLPDVQYVCLVSVHFLCYLCHFLTFQKLIFVISLWLMSDFWLPYQGFHKNSLCWCLLYCKLFGPWIDLVGLIFCEFLQQVDFPHLQSHLDGSQGEVVGPMPNPLTWGAGVQSLVWPLSHRPVQLGWICHGTSTLLA